MILLAFDMIYGKSEPYLREIVSLLRRQPVPEKDCAEDLVKADRCTLGPAESGIGWITTHPWSLSPHDLPKPFLFYLPHYLSMYIPRHYL